MQFSHSREVFAIREPFAGRFYAVSGRRLHALESAKRFEGLSSRTYIHLYCPARLYAGSAPRAMRSGLCQFLLFSE